MKSIGSRQTLSLVTTPLSIVVFLNTILFTNSVGSHYVIWFHVKMSKPLKRVLEITDKALLGQGMDKCFSSVDCRLEFTLIRSALHTSYIQVLLDLGHLSQ